MLEHVKFSKVDQVRFRERSKYEKSTGGRKRRRYQDQSSHALSSHVLEDVTPERLIGYMKLCENRRIHLLADGYICTLRHGSPDRKPSSSVHLSID